MASEAASDHDSYPGIGRLTYILCPLIVFFPILIAWELLLIPEGSLTESIVALLYFVTFYLIWPIQRLRNIGKSGWYFLLFLIPLVNIYVALLCLCAPPGYQEHKQMDFAGVALLTITIVPLVILIGLLLFSIAL